MFENPPPTESIWGSVLTPIATAIAGGITMIIAYWLKNRKKGEIEATGTPHPIDSIEDEQVKLALRHLQKKTETILRVVQAIFNAKGDAFWISDKDGKCIYASDELARIIGLDKQEVLGDGWVTNLAEADKEKVYKAWDFAVKQKRGFIMKYSFIHTDETEIRVSSNAQPIVVDNQLEGFIGVLTEQKK